MEATKQIVCRKICEEANKSDSLCEIEKAKEHPNEEKQKFYYGQAQKWLNMTMKYMWLTGLWKDEFDRLLPMLHIPVDSFIIEAVWHEGFEEDGRGWIKDEDVQKLSVNLPCENTKRKGKYADDKTVSWSKWNDSEYINFQTSLRSWCKDEAPIIWEGRAWIKIANRRGSL